MIVKTLIKTVVSVVFILLAPSAYAQICEDVFPDGLQSNKHRGSVSFAYGAQLFNNPDNILSTPKLYQYRYYRSRYRPLSCDSARCEASGSATPSISVGFNNNYGRRKIRVGFARSYTVKESTNGRYRDIYAGGYSKLTIKPRANGLRAKRLFLGYRATLNLAPGDYWFEHFHLSSQVRVNVVGEGTARIFVKKQARIGWNSWINYSSRNADASRLFLYADKGIRFSPGVRAAGVFYSNRNAYVAPFAKLKGAINASRLHLSAFASVSYTDDIYGADYGEFCTAGNGGDRDGDGVSDDQDAFPDDPTEWADLDGDGIGDNADTDRDGDGISNEYEEQVGTDPNDASDTPADLDADGIPDALDEDIDGDGVANADDAFPRDPSESSDLDNDGIGDNADTDRDGDGISNDYEEQVGTDPNDATDTPPDLDSDGIPDALDEDIDGDGVANADDAFPRNPSESSDLDGDGIGDNADTDRDGDGISNAFEIQLGTDPNDPLSVPADFDGDGVPDLLDDDIDGDGVANADDAFPRDPAESSDLDGDGIGDNADTDRDGDGISNDYEEQVGTDPNDATDTPADLDSDGIPDSLDSDIDGDGVDNEQDAFPRDPNESSDLDNDGIGDNADTDRDGDGISNAYEEQVGTDPNDASSTPPDLDSDGIPDSLDSDIDGDGVDNEQDAFPRDPNESSDLDNDGIGDNADTDRDGDGISNDYEEQVGTDPNDASSTPPDLDSDGIPDSLDSDIDGDGVDNENDAFPRDPNESSNIDGDGIGDNADTDRDGDGISNDYEEQVGTDPNDASSTPPDLDSDGIPDSLDSDIDGDGVDNENDAFPRDPNESSDLDNDGIGDNADTDRDGDGISNDYEEQVGTDPNDASSTPPDLDSDGIPDSLDSDIDGDGVDNENDAFPRDPNESSDIDGDGIGDNADTDRDGDGISNDYEEQVGTDPNDASSTPLDLDSDGIPDSLDSDIDGDGVDNEQDAFPRDPNESSDLDNDGIGDNADTDRDGDGISNDYEEQVGTDPNDASSTPPDLDSDGIPDSLDSDIDGDGVDNEQDAFPRDPNESSDLDNDGIGDNADTDRDGDGISNDYEDQVGTDPNDATDTPADLDSDGIPDSVDEDRDGDGVDNASDAFPDDPTESSDLDNDGIGDNADTDRDGDGISNDYEEQVGADPNDATDTPADLDSDGIPDSVDDDRDGDGVNNDNDAFPDDPAESSDLDNDGIGDNADTDRDGDGADNDFEQERGTDPNDATDYPDTVKPQVQLNNASGNRTVDAEVTVTGVASDTEQPYSGVATVSATSSLIEGVTFQGAFDSATGTFDIQVPIELGDNLITVTVIDNSDNQNQSAFSIERITVPKIVSLSPASGTVSTSPTATISGVIESLLPASEFVLSVNDSQISTTSTGQGNNYEFSYPNVALRIGLNSYEFALSSEFGGETRTVEINHIPQGSENLPVPTISDSTPSDGRSMNQSLFRFSAQIESFAGPLSVSLNGNEVLSANQVQQFYNLSELVDFAGSDETTVTIVATDTLGRSTEREFTFYRDESAPALSFDDALMPTPAVTTVDIPVVTISGTVSDTNLAGMLVNNQPVVLQPGGDQNTYNFKIAVKAGKETPQPVSFVAYDRSGNKASVEFLILNTASASLSALLPPNDSEFVAQSVDPINLQVAARLSNTNTDQTVVAYLASAPQNTVALDINGTLASGFIDLPAEQASQTIVYELQDAQGNRVTQDTRNVSVTPAQDVPVEVVRQEPVNNEQYVEPNTPIEVYFNQAVDLSLLQISLSETLHGKSYINADPLGEDFIRAQGYVLTDINRDREAVAGQVSLIPGAAGAVFAPNRNYGYNAELFLSVTYDGQTLLRSRFKVRELPTFINGAVTDQFGQPLPGINVSIPELDRQTTTNGDGGFAFGYQEAADKVIDSGRYTVLVNDGFANRRFGTVNNSISVQGNRINSLPRYVLQELNDNIAFATLSSASNNVLLGGDLQIDLSDPQARALFPNSRTSGAIHAQFLPFEHMGVQTYRFAPPHWLFGVQPKGVEIEGDVTLKMAVPKLRGGYDYIDPDVFQYVVLLGYSQQGQVVEPIGVGEIINNTVESRGKVHLTSLDYLGYSQVFPNLTPDLERYANGDITLLQLKAALQSQFQEQINAQSGG